MSFILKPRQALNKAFLKLKPLRAEIELFKRELTKVLKRSNDTESEEFHKNLISDFLKNCWYAPEHFINTKGRTDLVVHNGKKSKSPVGVVLEVKKPTNRGEMVRRDELNVKAMQELLLYYLRERISGKNLELRHLVVTNIYEWFVFDAQLFEKVFVRDKKLVKQFEEFEAGRLSGRTTDFFYSEIAQPTLEAKKEELEFAHFDIRDYEKPLLNDDPADDRKLVALYKLLSPEHLLKKPFANDSNSLNEDFYLEMLHIIGLKQTGKSKKLIERNPPDQRDPGSLMENAIEQLELTGRLRKVTNPSRFGKSSEERLFNLSLELVITWINRILFLKLLEAQLLNYHGGDERYAFLRPDRIRNFDDLNSLFFAVLDRMPEERSAAVREEFARVPYLNSSLFEATELEEESLFVNSLRDDREILLHPKTVLKTYDGKRRSGRINSLEYLFSFLNYYDFSSEGGEDIQEDNKTLINASVLGLIFEKINGYKDGSFFTPGFITMYMCRETIRRAVLQKFREVKQWECGDMDELYDRIEDRDEANHIVNSLKICDPAVGSGHFLVSALNEMIAVKNDLKILQDRSGRRLKEYHFEVVNDELMVTDEEGALFEYRPGSRESQRVQEALFHEKKTIIENCLFGVDINPNSVKICRLRLWIELLKNAYYKEDGQLETLPNIDINIKCGNSLISRFDLDSDLRKALQESNYSIEAYRAAVQSYHRATEWQEKQDVLRVIHKIKESFRSEIGLNDPLMKRASKLRGEIYKLANQSLLFEESEKEKETRRAKEQKLAGQLEKVETQVEEIHNNAIYENAFEWRFEFPEVLDENGDFRGFDVVIGNPPYMRVQEISKTQHQEKKIYEKNYSNAKASYDLANIFFELAVNISSAQSNNAYIFPHKFFNSSSTTVFRKYLKKGQYIKKLTHFGANMVFDDADTYTCIAQFSKSESDGFWFYRTPFKSDFENEMIRDSNYERVTYSMIERASKLYGSNQWILFDRAKGFEVFEKIYRKSQKFEDVFQGIYQGIATSMDNLYVVDCIDDQRFKISVPLSNRTFYVERTLFKPFAKGKEYQRYSYLKPSKFVFFPYKINDGDGEILSIDEIQETYPLTFKYLMDHKKEFKSRESGRAGRMKFWHGYIYPKNLSKFDQVKLTSMEIASSHPNVVLDLEKCYHPTTAYSWIKKSSAKESYQYLLGIANSKLLWWFIKTTGDTLQGDARRFKTNYLNPFPLPESPDPVLEKKIEEIVSTVIETKKQDPSADTSELEGEIDGLVYELYGLTEKEVKIIEKT